MLSVNNIHILASSVHHCIDIRVLYSLDQEYSNCCIEVLLSNLGINRLLPFLKRG